MRRGWLRITMLVVGLSFVDALAAYGDTLFKDKAPVAIGYGTTVSGTVYWTNCSRKQRSEYKQPPYWVHKVDNCSLRPKDFGLRRVDRKYVVVDERIFQQFFPEAKRGDAAHFRIDNEGVELSFGNALVKLRR